MPYKDREQQRRAQRISAKRRRLQKREWLITNKGGQCVDCGNNDSRVIEFDHVRGQKEGKVIGRMLAGSITSVHREADKCELVCANCHRIRELDRISQSCGETEDAAVSKTVA